MDLMLVSQMVEYYHSKKKKITNQKNQKGKINIPQKNKDNWPRIFSSKMHLMRLVV